MTQRSRAGWTAAHAQLPVVRGYTLGTVRAGEGRALVDSTVELRPELDPVVGLVPGTVVATWVVLAEDGGWRVDFGESTLMPQYPPADVAPAAARAWVAERAGCGDKARAALLGTGTLADELCDARGRAQVGAPVALEPSESSDSLLAAFGPDVFTWARVVPVSAPARVGAVLAPVGAALARHRARRVPVPPTHIPLKEHTMKSRSRRTRVVVPAALAGVALALSGLVVSGASSHREAPLISKDPVADNTDTYAFVSPDQPDTVTLVANWIPFELPAGGPNFNSFGDDVLYKINVDTDGDAVANTVYEWRFKTTIGDPNTFLYNTGPVESISDETLNVKQTYTLTRVTDGKRTVMFEDAPVAPANVGPRSMPNYDALAAEAVVAIPDGSLRSFAGPRDDPFFADIGSVFDLLGLRPLNSAHAIPLPDESGVDGLAGFNVHSVVLQVPTSRTRRGRPGHRRVVVDRPLHDQGVRWRQGQGQGQVHPGLAASACRW